MRKKLIKAAEKIVTKALVDQEVKTRDDVFSRCDKIVQECTKWENDMINDVIEEVEILLHIECRNLIMAIDHKLNNTGEK